MARLAWRTHGDARRPGLRLAEPPAKASAGDGCTKKVLTFNELPSKRDTVCCGALSFEGLRGGGLV